MRTPFLSLMAALLLSAPAVAAPVSTSIKLDNFGYRTSSTKYAIFTADPGTTIELRNTSDTTVYTVPTANIVSKTADTHSGDAVWRVDFSGFTTAGTYRIYSSTLGVQSYDFTIANDVYASAVRQAMKTFYYQRCNTPKATTYAGNWADTTACHTGDSSMGVETGHLNHGTLDLSGGWHDAGDYNKYVWRYNALAIYFLLRSYEDNPNAFPDDSLNIEDASANTTPDILDEVKWELDWMKKMQLTGTETNGSGYAGAVLSRIQQSNRTLFNSPPSADTTVRYYYDPDLESAAVLAGSFAYASRIYGTVSAYSTYAATLKDSANKAWDWLADQSESGASNDVKRIKVWAAAEIFRINTGLTDQTSIDRANEAQAYVDGFHSSWAASGLSLNNPQSFDTLAAFTYYGTSAGTQTIRDRMKALLQDGVATLLYYRQDNYENGMQSYHYDWSSNAARAAHGLFLQIASRLGTYRSDWYSAAYVQGHSEEFLHYLHGRNPLSMVYLTNMASLGGEHSVWQLYHGWFGAAGKSHSVSNYIGKPSSVTESAYPYYSGTDNHGVSDNKSSTYGPAPGFVPGGPNPHYVDNLSDCRDTVNASAGGGTANPPIGSAYNKYYRDWNDTTWVADSTSVPGGKRACAWRLNENSISVQAMYVALGSYFMQ
jgi:endoglucanase